METQAKRPFHLLSWLLSRFSFVAAHLLFLYLLNFLFNDPFHLGGNTLDGRQGVEGCRSLIVGNALFDLGLFALWWGSHSILARKPVKQAFGLWQHPIERPLYATVACVTLFLNLHYWRPISDCAGFSVAARPVTVLVLSGLVILAATAVIVGFLWSLPGHVFGTDHHQFAKGGFPKPQIIRRFPYGLVRHPAAAGFLWLYWAVPAYTMNHLFFAGLWTLFIFVGTLLFEESFLRSDDEFGREYLVYRREVSAFYPNLRSLARLLKKSR